MEMNEALKSRPLTPEELKQISGLFDCIKKKCRPIRIGPNGYFMEKRYNELASDIYNMEMRQGDIVVTSVLRSGTTWTQELVWMIANDLNYEKAAAEPLIQRYQFLEFPMFFDETASEILMENTPDIEKTRKIFETLATPVTKFLSDLPSPRFIKSHLPMSLLNPNILDTAKVVYVARDPRDVTVSSFFHIKSFNLMRFTGSLKDLWYGIRNDLFYWMPYFAHVKEAWALRHHPNMLFLFYEELCKDMPASIRRVAHFLGKELTPAQMERLCDHLSFENFKNNQSVNYDDMKDNGIFSSEGEFIRKGKAGGWRDYFDEEMERDAERWIADNLRDSDFTFPNMKK